MVLLVLALTSPIAWGRAQDKTLDDIWMEWVFNPPQAVLGANARLSARADTLVAEIVTNGTSKLAVGGNMDVVCSGGDNFDNYFMGVQMVLTRLSHATDRSAISLERWAGASSGGEMPFELLLKGENVTLSGHLAYGLLMQTHPASFANTMEAVALQDHHWRLMAHNMTLTYASSLSKLDGVDFLALTCLDPIFPKLVIVSNFTSPEQAEHAFIGTGTVAETYDGMLCSDGGSASGPKMTPLFQDGIRPQLIVDLMQTGQPPFAAFKYNMSWAEALVRQGQDEAVTFMQTGKCRADAITLCPKGANVKKNQCNK